MIDKLGRIWHSRAFMMLCVLWMAGVIIGTFAPKIDAAIRPAVSSFTVERADSFRRDDAVYLSGTMVKNRCKFLAVNVVGYSNNVAPVQLPVLFQDAKTDQTENRPKGPNSLGPWRIGIMAEPDIWGISLHASHQCGSGLLSWTIQTDLGPVIVLDSIKLRE